MLTNTAWIAFPYVQVDSTVHRVVGIRALGAMVHDEVTVELHPWTGCGTALSAPGPDIDPFTCGFRRTDVPLTCVICASGVFAAGDRARVVRKEALFGVAYGLKNGAMRHYVTSVAMYRGQQIHYAAADAYNAAALHRRLTRQSISADFRRRWAHAVLR